MRTSVKANREKLLAVMMKAGVSVRKISETTGIHRATLYNVLEGRSVRPQTLEAVARVLGVSAAEITDASPIKAAGSGGKEVET